MEHLIEHVKHAPCGAGTTSAAATLAATVDPPERRGVGACTFPSMSPGIGSHGGVGDEQRQGRERLSRRCSCDVAGGSTSPEEVPSDFRPSASCWITK